MTTASKTNRLEARVSQDHKILIEKAAALEGLSLTDFIVSNLVAASHRVIQEHQILRLSLEDSEAFVNALRNPPEPNERLKLAAVRYKQLRSVQ